ncbi:hypothetical protein COC58_27610 [Bacillus cereus]|nr:hypothetical protein CON05_26020 [Bacillus cereus]PGS34468.1 hypothetical protein COC58_27610 [Bacillus cereus]
MRGTAYFYCHLLSVSRYILKIADKSGRIADKNSFTNGVDQIEKNEPYTRPFFILQKCKVNVMLTNSSSPPKSAK